MNTLVFENLDQYTAELLKQFAEKLGLSVTRTIEEGQMTIVPSAEQLEKITSLQLGLSELNEYSVESLRKLIEERA